MTKRMIAFLLSFMLVLTSAGMDVSAAAVDDRNEGVQQEEMTDGEEDTREEPAEETAGEDAEEAVTEGEEDVTEGYDGEPDEYTVRYNANGGKEDPIEKTYTVGMESNPDECEFTRDGYEFKEWNTKADGTGISYNIFDSFTDLAQPGETADLYAMWEIVTYTITYYLDGGENDKDNPTSYTVETPTITFKPPRKKGYKFDGWYTDADRKTRIYTIPKGSTEDRSVYAKWTAVTYTVKFDGNGATGGKTADLKCTYGQNANLTANGFVRKGFVFTGWNTKADGTGTGYADRAAIKDLTDEDGKVITFYAQWKIEQYSIKYNLDGGNNDPANPSSYTVNTDTINLKDAKKKGYAFKGWFADKAHKEQVKKIPKGSTGNKKFYAKWKANTYKIKFDGNKATSGKMATLKGCKYGTKYKLPKNEFKRKGYSFAGWNTKKSGKGVAFANKQKVKNLTTKNNVTVTLYSQWKLKEYTITYVLEKGKNSEENPATYTVKTKDIKLKPATRKGYTFQGWYSDKKHKNRVKVIPKGSVGNRTLYAKWKANRYRITFDGNKADHGSMSDMKELKYGKTYRLSENEFRRDGYTFTGWNTKANGSGLSFKDEADVKNLSTKNGAIVTFYAQWEPIKYTVVFYGNGSTSGMMQSMTCTYGESYNLTANAFVRTKYKFDCWNTKKDGSGTYYADCAKIKNLTTTNGKRVKLYAQWDEDFSLLSMNISKPTKNAIASYINSHPYSSSDSYYIAPKFIPPYTAGQLTTDTKISTLNLLNTCRYIAGLQTNVNIDDTFSDHASKGTFINKLNNRMEHRPGRPSVIADAQYDQLFNDGYDGCSHSNLASGYPNLSMRDAVDLWMDDSDSSNIGAVGHRRWFLYPSLTKVGFGKTDGTYNGNGGSFCAAYVISGDYSGYSSTRVAWPANNMPTGFFDDGQAWSLSTGRYVDKSKVKVKVVRDSDHKVWTFTSGQADGDFYVNNDGYGTVGCVIFRPKDIEIKPGVSYTVKAFLYDTEEMIRYNVKFFSLSDFGAEDGIADPNGRASKRSAL